jgi:hypothetical protein
MWATLPRFGRDLSWRAEDAWICWRRMRISWALPLLLAALLPGCQGERSAAANASGSGSGSGSSAAPPVVAEGSDAVGSAAPISTSPATPADGDEPATDAEQLALGAIPAWQAVVDRAELLLRRKQHGVVIGVIGDPISADELPPAPGQTDDDDDETDNDGATTGAGSAGSGTAGFGSAARPLQGPPLTWLVDDTDGNGSLAIRVAFSEDVPAKGTRVAVGGGWTLTPDRRWYWKADALSKVGPPASPPAPLAEPPVPPGRVIGKGDPPPGSRPVKKATDNGIITFQVVGAPEGEGDGWRIANELGDPPAAILYLPGERISYGGHDLRSPDERWRLKRGTTYWVRIGKIKKRTGTLPPLMWARTPPTKW